MADAGGRPKAPLMSEPEEREYLERQVRRRRVSRSLSERCRIILLCADGIQSRVVAAELGVHERTVGKWRRRFLKDRIEGLLDEARPGRPRTIADDQVAAVIERTLRSKPNDATHWWIRSMAGATGFSHTMIRPTWAAFELQPHRSETFKLSSDPLSSTRSKPQIAHYVANFRLRCLGSVDIVRQRYAKGGKAEEANKPDGCLVVARGDAAELLAAIELPLDLVPVAPAPVVTRSWITFGLWRTTGSLLCSSSIVRTALLS